MEGSGCVHVNTGPVRIREAQNPDPEQCVNIMADCAYVSKQKLHVSFAARVFF
jgi:hypothetical protein